MNILGCSALIILILDPFTVHSVSFQFSFLALAGILIFGPTIFRVWAVRPRLARYIWGIVAISVAAQIPIAPAMLSYFGEISLLSPVTSIVAIPAAFLIVAGGITVIGLQFIAPGIATVIGKVLTLITHSLNAIAAGAAELPVSTAHALIDTPTMVAIYSVIVCLAVRVLTGRRVWTFIAIAPALAAVFLYIAFLTHALITPALVIFPGSSLQVEYLHRGVSHTFFDTQSLSAYDRAAATQIRDAHFVQQVVRHSFAHAQHVHEIGFPPVDLHIYHGRSCPDMWHEATGQQTVLWYPQEPGDTTRIASMIASGVSWVILSEGMRYHAKAQMKRVCRRNNIPYHDLSAQGIFYLEMKPAGQ